MGLQPDAQDRYRIPPAAFYGENVDFWATVVRAEFLSQGLNSEEWEQELVARAAEQHLFVQSGQDSVPTGTSGFFSEGGRRQTAQSSPSFCAPAGGVFRSSHGRLAGWQRAAGGTRCASGFIEDCARQVVVARNGRWSG
jgi:hypothetical protein